MQIFAILPQKHQISQNACRQNIINVCGLIRTLTMHKAQILCFWLFNGFPIDVSVQIEAYELCLGRLLNKF